MLSLYKSLIHIVLYSPLCVCENARKRKRDVMMSYVSTSQTHLANWRSYDLDDSQVMLLSAYTLELCQG